MTSWHEPVEKRSRIAETRDLTFTRTLCEALVVALAIVLLMWLWSWLPGGLA